MPLGQEPVVHSHILGGLSGKKLDEVKKYTCFFFLCVPLGQEPVVHISHYMKKTFNSSKARMKNP